MMKIEALYKDAGDSVELTLDEQGELTDNDDEIVTMESIKDPTSRYKKIKLRMNDKSSLALMYLIKTNTAYRRLFYDSWSPKKRTCAQLKIQMLMTSTGEDKLDVPGNHLASGLLWEFIELEDALHWLSTLGGAFSNLGEHDIKFAKRAGDNAFKQLTLAHKFGDKTVIAKCLLFVAMSLMQQNFFQQSAAVVKHVYAHCRAPDMKELAGTNKLLAMCRGIWARLKYEAGKASNGNEKKCLTESKKGNDKPADEIEIEFKFEPPNDIHEKLINLGAKLTGEKSMTDIYLDTVDFSLIQKDFWLRYRNGKVELKMPAGHIHRDQDITTVYKEVTCPEGIEQELGQSIPGDVNMLPDGWAVLAKVSTSRQMWQMNEFNIVLDLLPDGFQIGEIELVSSSASGAEAAAEQLNTLSNKLALKKQTKGKVNHCLRSQNPEAFKILSEIT